MAAIRAVRGGDAKLHGLNPFVLQEARAVRKRLCRIWKVQPARAEAHVDRRELALAALLADPATAYVARRRKRRVAWSNGGTEVELSRGSAVNQEKSDLLVVLETQAMGLTARKTSIIITCAMPVPPRWFLVAGIGEDEVRGAAVERGKALSRVARVHAGCVLETREEGPAGALARATIGLLFLEGRIFKEARKATADRLDAARLYARLNAAGLVPAHLEWLEYPWTGGVPKDEEWVRERLEELGVETGEDLPLLSERDLTVSDLPATLRQWQDRRYPRVLDMGDAIYRVHYDLGVRMVTMEKTDGNRKTPPALSFLPTFQGLSIMVKHHSKAWKLR